jgi:flavin reductase (DIM6/NTAB) family NADH-FMN oxidoreductase RutF
MKKHLGPSPTLFPMPAVLIGTYNDDGTANAMTAAWAAACCHSPPCLGVAVRSNRLTFSNIRKRGAFTINIPRATLAKQVDYLGIVSGSHQPDKLERINMGTTSGAIVDAPIIDVCPVNVECRLYKSLELGTHTWFVGEVMEVQADGELVRGDGKIDVPSLDPLVYATSVGEYWSMGVSIGRSYEIGKTLK